MTEVKYLKSMQTSFGKEVIKLTPQIPERTYFTRSCEHLLSVLSIYIMSEIFVNEAPRAVKYNELIISSLSLLNEFNTWEKLNEKLHAASNPDFNAVLENDALFDLNPNWKENDYVQRSIAMEEAKQRLELLEKAAL
ncbi:hypothetical protein E8M24_21870 [Bacillus thuringiensis]|uniref:hypothetical protein n=1 Tax=Bacillus TaxID=1386 RepID=UPI00125F0CCC|nr:MULTISPECIES: hypothetical protein [Bacillus]KAB5640584.1 hypothetical protein E8M24_21870 [Bacillus thuringiensis]MDV6039945.1 hypothetical protein [Bacillus sp. SM-B1]HDR5270483.1 hypothetical protein [Bacillus thuringiensis]